MVEYIEFCCAMFAVYLIARLTMAWTWFNVTWNPLKWYPRVPPQQMTGTGMEVGGLSQRLNEVRRDYAGHVPAPTDAFKKSQLMEDKRREIETRGLLQPPPAPAPDPTTEDHGLLPLLV